VASSTVFALSLFVGASAGAVTGAGIGADGINLLLRSLVLNFQTHHTRLNSFSLLRLDASNHFLRLPAGDYL